VPYEIVRYQRQPTCARRRVARDPSARKIARDHRQRQHHRRVGAIAEYIIDTYGNGRLIRRQDAGAAAYTYWLHYAKLGAAAVAAEIVVHADSERPPALLASLVRKVSNQALTTLVIRSSSSTWLLEGELGKSDGSRRYLPISR